MVKDGNMEDDKDQKRRITTNQKPDLLNKVANQIQQEIVEDDVLTMLGIYDLIARHFGLSLDTVRDGREVALLSGFLSVDRDSQKSVAEAIREFYWSIWEKRNRFVFFLN